MDTSELDVLGNRIGQNLTILRHSVHLNLLGVLDKLRHHHRMVFRHVGSQFQELLQFLLIRTDIHRGTREYVGRTHQHGEAHALHKLADIIHTRQRRPLWLVHAEFVEHL